MNVWAIIIIDHLVLKVYFPALFKMEKLNARVKNMKRQLDESEEEVTRLNGNKRKLQREVEENNEALELAQREVNQLRQRLK